MSRVGSSPRTRILPALYVASGAAALILEVTWSRLLTLQFGHTTGATSTVLAAFMGGLAAGSGIGGRLAERHDRRGALRLYAALELIIAIAALTLPIVIAAAQPLLEWAYADGQMPSRFGIARLAASLLALAIPTMAMGATYPLATRALAADRQHSEHAAGWLYTANTLGAAAGALIAGFLLLPALGIRSTTFVAAALNLAAAAAAWRLSIGLASEDAATRDSSAPVPSGQRAAQRTAPDQPGFEARQAAPDGARGSRRGSRGRRGRGGATTASAVGLAAFEADSARLVWVGLLAAATSGFVALANQVVWTRVLALIVGPTTFAFSGMVGVFIAGLAVGAAMGTRIARRRGAALWLGVMGLAGALAMIVAMQLTGRLLLWVATAAAPTSAFAVVVWRELAVAAVLLGPLSITFGAAFPLALAVVGGGGGSTSGRSGSSGGGLTPMRLSWTYAANTAGAIAGALVAGFVLVPMLGLQTTLRIAALASVVVSLVVLIAASARWHWRGRVAGVMVAAAVVAAVVTRGGWDPVLLSSGAYRFAPAVPAGMPADDLEAVLTAGDLLFYREGAAGTVAVRRLAGTTSLVIDGKPDASNAGDMLTQKLLAHLPLLLHPSPSRVCVLGLGSGVTAGAALTHAVAQLDVVEISQAVVSASQFFRTENRNVLADPRTRLLVADGRSHLRLSDARYDVVISEPSNPWMAGVAALFTREFMAGVRGRLAPGGLFCQWTHTYDMSPADLHSIVSTFLGEFPHASLWLVGESDVLLIGSDAPIANDTRTLAARFARPGVAEDLRTVAVSSIDDLAGLRVADTDALKKYAAGADPQTDDRMALEFSAPRSLAARTGHQNIVDLLALAPSRAPATDAAAPAEAIASATAGRAGTPAASATRAIPAASALLGALTGEQWASRGRMLLRAEAYDLAFAALKRAVAARPNDEEALEALSRAAAGAGKLEEAGSYVRGLLDANPANVPLRAALARLLMARGDPNAAIAAITSADLSNGPNGPNALDGSNHPTHSSPPNDPSADPRAQRELASIYADLGDADHLAPIVARLEREMPGSPDTHYFAASLAFLQGDLDTALSRAQAVIAARPNDARAYNLIGAALATQGQVDAARAAFAQSIAADPRDTGTYINAGSLELEHGRPDEALHQFAIALAVDITSDAARRGLAAARAALSHP